MSKIEQKVNGRSQTVDVESTTPLLYACKVLINAAAVPSCVMPVSTVKGEITTLEGLASNGKLHPLQRAWIDEQVP